MKSPREGAADGLRRPDTSSSSSPAHDREGSSELSAVPPSSSSSHKERAQNRPLHIPSPGDGTEIKPSPCSGGLADERPPPRSSPFESPERESNIPFLLAPWSYHSKYMEPPLRPIHFHQADEQNSQSKKSIFCEM
jgi:hypothetical protein